MKLTINLGDVDQKRRFRELSADLGHSEHPRRFQAVRGLYLLATTALANLDPVNWIPRLHALVAERLRNRVSVPDTDWNVDWAASTLLGDSRHAFRRVALGALHRAGTADAAAAIQRSRT